MEDLLESSGETAPVQGVQARNYSYVFEFEQEFDSREVQGWVLEHWRPVCVWASFLYMLLVFGGQAYMSARPPFQLRGLLTTWNIFLAGFSMFGAARTLPEFIHTLSTGGLYHSICSSNFVSMDRVSGFWTWLFVLSKMPELVDTIFIVLRKQQLIFLHWYHHLTVFWYCWYCFSEWSTTARWFMVMNYIVHSLMYSYFALRAMRFRVPRPVAMVITSLQLLQMIIGCTINYMAFQFKQKGVDCGVSDNNLKLSLIMYTSYFVLFARFFHNAYFKSNSKCNGQEKGNTGFGNVIKSDKEYSNGHSASYEAVKDKPKDNVNIVEEQAQERLRSNGVCPNIIKKDQNNIETEEKKEK